MIKSDLSAFKKVAIVHDVLLEYGGAERVAEAILNMFPKSDFYTFFYNKKNKTITSAFDSYEPRSSFFSKFPMLAGLGGYFSILKFFSWLYFYFLDLSDYDLVVSSSHSYNAKMVRKPPKAFHVCYLHTPPKYLYREFNEISWVKLFPFNVVLFLPFSFMRFVDRLAARHPDIIVANSKQVAGRVKMYYGIKAGVIYPPVRLPKNKLRVRNSKYYLFISRLVKQKGIDMVINAANKYGFPLAVVGEGRLGNYVKKRAGKNIQFLGRVADVDMDKVYASAKALIVASKDEDFGIVAVEALANGVPVIAYKSGGTVEVVKDSTTGVLFTDFTPEALYGAMKRLVSININKNVCIAQAARFGEKEFIAKLGGLISQHAKNT